MILILVSFNQYLNRKRLAFKPEKGQNQWTRSCQNSGNDKRRRPIIIPGDNIRVLKVRLSPAMTPISWYITHC